MDSADTARLMALLQAYALAITALLRTHPQPELLRPAFASLVEADQTKFPPDQEVLYRAALVTLQAAIPPH